MDIESTVQGKAQKSHVKLWHSETVPGGTVKRVMGGDMNADGMQSILTITTTPEKFELGK
jgi:hypothetical protein